MLSKLTTKLALRKVGIPSDSFSFANYESKTSNKDLNDTPSSTFANPFANVTIPKSWHSWATPPPPPVELAPPPVINVQAPTSAKLRVPAGDGRPSVVVFLRHCGCPFAEKTFLETRRLANKHPNIHFIAVSHCTPASTTKWLSQLGGAWAVDIVIDVEREIYAQWGLGISNTWYLMNPWTQIARNKLGKEDGVWARECGEEGNRWQVGGAWVTDAMGMMRWGGPAKTADEIPNLIEGVGVLGFV